MEFMTLKQYAASRNVTYEAVRRQVVRYRKDLADHIIKKDGVQYLDSQAIAFLSEKRRASPLVVVHETNTEKIKELETEIESLRAKLMMAQDEIMTAQRKMIEMQDEVKQAAEDMARYNVLLEDHKKSMTERDQMRQELTETKATLEQTTLQLKLTEIDREKAEQEASSFQKSIFGFYRKRV